MTSQNQDKYSQQFTSNVTNREIVDPILDNRKIESKMKIHQYKGRYISPNWTTVYNSDINDNQENLKQSIVGVETLIPIDYMYKNVTLPLIFVNKLICGMSIEEQVSLVKDDIAQVIQYFISGSITPTEETISKFFSTHPGTMIYSPQLVKTIISIEEIKDSNRMCNQLIKHVYHEE